MRRSSVLGQITKSPQGCRASGLRRPAAARFARRPNGDQRCGGAPQSGGVLLHTPKRGIMLVTFYQKLYRRMVCLKYEV